MYDETDNLTQQTQQNRFLFHRKAGQHEKLLYHNRGII